MLGNEELVPFEHNLVPSGLLSREAAIFEGKDTAVKFLCFKDQLQDHV